MASGISFVSRAISISFIKHKSASRLDIILLRLPRDSPFRSRSRTLFMSILVSVLVLPLADLPELALLSAAVAVSASAAASGLVPVLQPPALVCSAGPESGPVLRSAVLVSSTRSVSEPVFGDLLRFAVSAFAADWRCLDFGPVEGAFHTFDGNHRYCRGNRSWTHDKCE